MNNNCNLIHALSTINDIYYIIKILNKFVDRDYNLYQMIFEDKLEIFGS
jgi:asparagine synthetase A